MMTFIWSARCMLLLLLSLLPVQSDTCSMKLAAVTTQILVVNDIIEKVHKERPFETLLFIQRGKDNNCPLSEINPLEIPTLRLDKETNISLKETFNSNVLALVCISELADSILLTALANNLNRMREARTIILLSCVDSDLMECLDIINQHASIYKLVNLIVIHLTSHQGSAVTYRLEPFPNPTLKHIKTFNKEQIFPRNWNNYKGKTAVFLPDMSPPRSIITIDPHTGEQKLHGAADRFILEFAKRYNIQLQWLRQLKRLTKMENDKFLNLTISGKIDIPTRPLLYSLKALSTNVEFSFFAGFTQIFVVVPCGQEMSIGDVYTGLKTYSTIALGAYFMFAIIETLFVASTDWIFQRRPSLLFSALVLNMRALAGVLGLPMPRRYTTTSLSLRQIIMVMSIFSLVFSCFFNASLSTLLIKHPHNRQIQNLKELRESGLKLKIDKSTKMNLDNELGEEFFAKFIPNSEYVSNAEWRRLLFALNTSYAYQSFSYAWHVLDKYQKTHKRRFLCRSSGMNMTGDIPLGYVMQTNSIFRLALNDFINWSWCFGLIGHWNEQAGQKMIENIHPTIAQSVPQNNQELTFTALNMEDFKWLWKLLAIFYSVAALVFMAEICVACWKI